MKKDITSLIEDLSTKKISYINKASFFENSLMYKILHNQGIMTKEELLNIFDEGEIFEQKIKDINFEELKKVRNILINIFVPNNEAYIEYSNDFLNLINKFNENTNVYFNVIEENSIDKIFLNLTYQIN